MGTVSKLPRLSEKQFMGQVVKLARLLGWLCYHTHTSKRSEPGFPDLVLVHAERGVIWCELKVGRNQPTPAQTLWLERLRAAGQSAFLWWPEDWPQIERVLRGGPRA